MFRQPSDQINFEDLHAIYRNSPQMAENLWEMIKIEAKKEFESGHRAAEVFEPVEEMRSAWNRASYIATRESFIEQWQPKGGIELSRIDTAAQTFILYQFWMKESVKRSQTQPRVEDPASNEWKKFSKEMNPKRWADGDWDIDYVSEQEAINHAALMADRFQKMYLRALRSLRDFRRYNPQVTINNPQQVNIAAEGGQQVNMKAAEETHQRKLSQ